MVMRVTRTDTSCTIILDENFDYTCRELFQTIYKENSKKTEYIIDFHSVRLVDSSALGLLLVLREYNGCDGSLIHLIHCNPQVKELFSTVKFSQFFNMESSKFHQPDKLEEEEVELEKTFQDLLKRRKHL